MSLTRILSVSAIEPKVKTPNEIITFAVDFTPLLQKTTANPPALAETLSGTPTVTITKPSGGADLTVDQQALNGQAIPDDKGGVIAASAAAQFRVAGGTGGSTMDYTLAVKCTTTGGNTREVICTLQVRAS